MKSLILTLFLFISAVLSMAASSRNSQVWEHPTVEHNNKPLGGYFLRLLEVTKVELTPDETILYFHGGYRPEIRYNFSGESYLLVDSVKYLATASEGIDYTVGIDTIRTESVDFKLYFPPLPKGTVKFDFVNNPDFHIQGISDGSTRRAQLIPSNWRDDKTGDWLIGLFDNYVVYDAHFWEYVGQKPDEKTNSFRITDGATVLKVNVSKAKDGHRKFKIGDSSYFCSAITGRTLPPYPSADHTKFHDTAYASGDSVELVGWLKDMPDWARERSSGYEISFYDMIGEDQPQFAPFDSLGRFSMKFPIDNTGVGYGDWKRTFLRNVFEPGQKYFLLHDYSLGQTLFMGPDSRVQNELMLYPLQWRDADWYEYNGRHFNDLLHDADSINTVLTYELDSICMLHPTLSDRFKTVHLTNERINSLARNLGYANIPDSVVPYVMEKCMFAVAPPYTLSRNFPRFIDDFMMTLNRGWNSTFDWDKYKDEVRYTPDELTIISQTDSLSAAFNQVYDSIADENEKEAYRQKHLQSNIEMLKAYIQVLNGESYQRVYLSKQFIHEIPHGLAVMDSMKFDPTIKDIWVAYNTFKIFSKIHASLPSEVLEILPSAITNSHILDRVLAENEKYLMIEQRTASSTPAADTSALQNLTEGDKILQELISPHRGKFILIDFWGTWCAPCRAALAESDELYKRLKDFDIVYIYLANNSPETIWRNLIEEYSVKGDNVYHYNLPLAQQELIENALKINAFPSYRIVDKEGNILDVSIDARVPGSIESMLTRLSSK